MGVDEVDFLVADDFGEAAGVAADRNGGFGGEREVQNLSTCAYRCLGQRAAFAGDEGFVAGGGKGVGCFNHDALGAAGIQPGQHLQYSQAIVTHGGGANTVCPE
jgi:hypothetical protein